MKAKAKRTTSENQKSAWLFLLPSLIIILVFSIYPLIRSFVMSFQSNSMLTKHFVGFENYVRLFHDEVFWRSIGNTALYAIIVVPVALIIALVIAWIIYDKIKHKAFFETLFFMPYVTSALAIGIVFRYFFNDSYGIINFILNAFGIGSVNWLTDIHMSMPTLIIFGIWSGLAFNIIILLSGLRNISEEHYKVADMFGATKFEQFWRITMPQLMPTITFLATVNIINAFKVYTQVYALFGGKAGVANSATTGVFYIYEKFHVDNRPGIAMAATVILFIIILAATFIQQKVLKRGDRK